MRRKRVRGESSGSDADRARADAAATLHVGGGITNDDDVAPRNVDTELFARTALRDGGQLGAQLVIRSVRTNNEPAWIDTHRLQLRACSRREVSSEQAKRDVVAIVQCVEKLWNTRHDAKVVTGCAELLAQPFDVQIEQCLHAAIDMIVGVADEAHELAHDLRVSLAVEPVIGGSSAAEDLDERAVDSAPAGTVGEQQRAVDVKEDELHDITRAS